MQCFFRCEASQVLIQISSYSDFHIFPRVGVLKGLFWPPCSFVVYLPYSMLAGLFSLGYLMITQPLGNNDSLCSNPREVPYLAIDVNGLKTKILVDFLNFS